MKLKLELQYFEGCPNHKLMNENLIEAIKGFEEKVELNQVLVEDEITARRISFRGSPTLLIDGEDIEGVPIPEEPNMACRFYVNGIPSSNKIRELILRKINKE